MGANNRARRALCVFWQEGTETADMRHHQTRVALDEGMQKLKPNVLMKTINCFLFFDLQTQAVQL